MSFVLTDDQSMLARTAGSFLAESSPVSRLRKLRDARDERGYSLDLYRKMAELGWTAIAFSEADGGLGMGFAEVVLVTEALGRALAPEPLIPSLMLAGQALARAGSAAQKQAWLGPAIAGEKVLALAYAEQGSRFDPASVATRAERVPGGYELTGEKQQVWGGHLADAYVVSARLSGSGGGTAPAERGGIALFLVPASAKGISSTRQWRIDSLNAATVGLDGVQIKDADLIGSADDGHALLADAIDRATVALCGEMLGGMSEAFDRTVAYLKERKQFGVPVGSFQALKHRAARMYIEIELARSAVMAAARAIDDAPPRSAGAVPPIAAGADAPTLISVAKARVSDAYCLVANEAVQMHGGIGMTDEHEIGFFIKRARACEMTFGDAAYHRDRFAALGGF